MSRSLPRFGEDPAGDFRTYASWAGLRSRKQGLDVGLLRFADEAEGLLRLDPAVVDGFGRREEALPEVVVGTDVGCVGALRVEGALAVPLVERGGAEQLEAGLGYLDLMEINLKSLKEALG